MRSGARYVTAFFVVLCVTTGCVGPKRRYQQLWVGMEQALVEQAYRGKPSQPSTLVFDTDPDRPSRIGPFRISCRTYGRLSGYTETVCFEGGVLAAKGFLRLAKLVSIGCHHSQ